MATLTVNKPDAAAAGVTPVTAVPSASDVFPALGSDRYLITVVGPTTGTVTIKVDDPNTQTPPNATAFDPDVTLGPVASTVKKQYLLRNAGRYRDASGNITLNNSASSAFTGSTIEITEV